MKQYKFDRSYGDYFQGGKFTTCLSARVSRPELTIPLRCDILADAAVGKNVIHVGCVDHPEILECQRAQNLWLHDRLLRSARRCVGIDLNKSGVEHLLSLGYKDLFVHDLIRDQPIQCLMEEKWDTIVLGEVVEHLDNPVNFFRAIREKYAGVVSEIILTTPNALKLENFVHALSQREIVSSDHRCWFSPLTMAKTLTESGYKVQWYTFCQYGKVGPRPLQQTILRIFPVLRDTLVMTAKL